MTMIKNFLNDETGAVTVDWVALTAGILLLGIAVVYSIFLNGIDPLVESINNQLSSASAGLCEAIVAESDSTGTGTGGSGTTDYAGLDCTVGNTQ